MNKTFQIFKAEILKYHRSSAKSLSTYFSLLIWPVIMFANAYYSYKPFDFNAIQLPMVGNGQRLITYLLIGYLGYISFWSMVQSAWQMSFERQDGTLEVVLLSPANRMAIMYGRALGSLMENIWLFSIFSFFVGLYIKEIPLHNLVSLPVVFLEVFLSATVWGGFLNVVFMFSRDASILFTILDEPMVLFSGVRMPTLLFPLWAKVVSVIFPLTHVLVLARSQLIGFTEDGSLYRIIYLLSSNAALIFLTWLLINKTERNARRTGNFTFY